MRITKNTLKSIAHSLTQWFFNLPVRRDSYF